jgi:hypothetical protein
LIARRSIALVYRPRLRAANKQTYVSGDYQVEGRRVLAPIFEEYGVDLIFNSPTIVDERSHPIRNNQVDLREGVVDLEGRLVDTRRMNTSR